MADRACDPTAVEVERSEVRGTKIFAGVHLHAIDDGKEITAAQVVVHRRLAQRMGDEMARTSGIEIVDSPPAKRREPRSSARPAALRRRCRQPLGKTHRPRTSRSGGASATAASPNKTRFRPPRPDAGWFGAAHLGPTDRRRHGAPHRSSAKPSQNADHKGSEKIGSPHPPRGARRREWKTCSPACDGRAGRFLHRPGPVTALQTRGPEALEALLSGIDAAVLPDKGLPPFARAAAGAPAPRRATLDAEVAHLEAQPGRGRARRGLSSRQRRPLPPPGARRLAGRGHRAGGPLRGGSREGVDGPGPRAGRAGLAGGPADAGAMPGEAAPR